MGANSTDNDGYLPVFDTCDVVRRKIRNFLNQFALSKTAFLKTVSKSIALIFKSGNSTASWQ
ncbi:hypothetical protein BM221_010474 [Beauveria bassiana]|uniref:DUF7726 domain-containing protein n=1 Tax=Beauveria bassiana TaxID=176275 RepID=A0A2N6N8Y5_BEABA|nr:hypothetical protein BM221_010474 [Beauveria bassiana]